MTIPPVRGEDDSNHVADHNLIRGELLDNKTHRDVVSGNPHGVTLAALDDVDLTGAVVGDVVKLGVGGWQASADTGGAGGGNVAVLQDNIEVTDAATALDFVGPDISVTNPSGSTVEVRGNGRAPRYAGVGVVHFPTMAGDTPNFGDYQRCYFVPFLGNGMEINSIGARVDTANAAGVVRFGLYELGEAQLDRLVDFGTQPANAAGQHAMKTITPVELEAEKLYYLAVCIQTNSAVKLRGGEMVMPMQSIGTVNLTENPCKVWYQDGVTGALPATSFAPYNGNLTHGNPWLWLTQTAG